APSRRGHPDTGSDTLSLHDALPIWTGDVVGPASSVDGEVALFDGTTGKLLKSATATGVAKLTSGVLSASAVNLASEVTGTLPTRSEEHTSELQSRESLVCRLLLDKE